jgi:hypothetical protein
MQVHHDGDHSLACLDSYTCAITFYSFVCLRSLNLLFKCSSETTRLSARRPSGAKQCSSRTKSRSLAAEYKNSCAFAASFASHMAKHTKEVICEGRSQGVWRLKIGGQKVVICCVESERDPVHTTSQCQFRRKQEMEFVRQVSLLSEINQQLKQEFGRVAMKRSRQVHVLQT